MVKPVDVNDSGWMVSDPTMIGEGLPGDGDGLIGVAVGLLLLRVGMVMVVPSSINLADWLSRDSVRPENVMAEPGLTVLPPATKPVDCTPIVSEPITTTSGYGVTVLVEIGRAADELILDLADVGLLRDRDPTTGTTARKPEEIVAERLGVLWPDTRLPEMEPPDPVTAA